MGVQSCAQPVINGEGLIDIFRRVEEREPLGYAGYAGLAPAELFGGLSDCLGAETAGCKAQVLRCVCGDRGCAGALVEIVIRGDAIVWQNLRASRFADSSADVYAGIGPFRFDRVQYESSLADPSGRMGSNPSDA